MSEVVSKGEKGKLNLNNALFKRNTTEQLVKALQVIGFVKISEGVWQISAPSDELTKVLSIINDV